MKSKQGQDFILVRLDAEKIDSLEGMIGNAVRSAFEDRPLIPISPSKKRYYTKKELSEMSGVSIRQIDYKRKTGELKYIKNGRSVLFRISDIEDWLEAGLVDKRGQL